MCVCVCVCVCVCDRVEAEYLKLVTSRQLLRFIIQQAVKTI